jgi:ribosomal protein L11 methyltransferase
MRKLRRFEQRIKEFQAVTGDGMEKGTCAISWATVQDEDWSDNWKKYFHPEKVGGMIVIKPTWEDYTASPDDIVIELDPGAAFGTGTHPTTAMCIRELETLVRGGMRVFDVGTGSGVLSIAAAKLGATDVTAMDYDRTAVNVAEENIRQNRLDGQIKTGVSDLLKSFEGKADLIVANIIADIIIRLFDELDEHLAEHGQLLASGIISERLADVTAACIAHGFVVDKVIEEKRLGGNGHQPWRREMRRLFYKGLLQDTIEITGADAHHLMHVMRARPGQEIIVVDDENQVARMEMTAFCETAVTLTLRERLAADTESPIQLVLAQCLLKADKMDFVVQKAVELGAVGVVPVRSQNCVVRYDAKKAAGRRDRWQKIADEAAKQCGRTALLSVEPVTDIEDFLQQEAACGRYRADLLL